MFVRLYILVSEYSASISHDSHYVYHLAREQRERNPHVPSFKHMYVNYCLILDQNQLNIFSLCPGLCIRLEMLRLREMCYCNAGVWLCYPGFSQALPWATIICGSGTLVFRHQYFFLPSLFLSYEPPICPIHS
jgi:hypothetical protein